MKQLRSTLILLVLAVLVGGYIYFNERGPAAREGNTVLLRTNPDSVQTIQLRAGAKVVQISRSGDSWQVSSLQNGQVIVSVPADEDAVAALLQVLELVQSDAPATGTDLKPFGLDKPSKTLEVDGQTLEFGTSPSFDPQHIYARVGKQIALVPVELSRGLTPSLDVWRDRHILRFDSQKVTAIALQSPVLKADFQKTDESWMLTKPLEVEADANAMRGLLSTLNTTQIGTWLDDKGADIAKWGLDKPIATLRMGEATLAIGKKQRGGYAALSTDSPSVFLLPGGIFDTLSRPLAFWRTKTVLPVKSPELTRLTITSHGASKTFVKGNGRWGVVGRAADGTTNSRVLDVVTWATGLQARDFIDHPARLADYDLDQPVVTLDLTTTHSTTFKIGQSKDKVYAWAGGPTVYEIAPDAIENVQEALDAFFPKPKLKAPDSKTTKTKN